MVDGAGPIVDRAMVMAAQVAPKPRSIAIESDDEVILQVPRSPLQGFALAAATPDQIAEPSRVQAIAAPITPPADPATADVIAMPKQPAAAPAEKPAEAPVTKPSRGPAAAPPVVAPAAVRLLQRRDRCRAGRAGDDHRCASRARHSRSGASGPRHARRHAERRQRAAGTSRADGVRAAAARPDPAADAAAEARDRRDAQGAAPAEPFRLRPPSRPVRPAKPAPAKRQVRLNCPSPRSSSHHARSACGPGSAEGGSDQLKRRT